MIIETNIVDLFTAGLLTLLVQHRGPAQFCILNIKADTYGKIVSFSYPEFPWFTFLFYNMVHV